MILLMPIFVMSAQWRRNKFDLFYISQFASFGQTSMVVVFSATAWAYLFCLEGLFITTTTLTKMQESLEIFESRIVCVKWRPTCCSRWKSTHQTHNVVAFDCNPFIKFHSISTVLAPFGQQIRASTRQRNQQQQKCCFSARSSRDNNNKQQQEPFRQANIFEWNSEMARDRWTHDPWLAFTESLFDTLATRVIHSRPKMHYHDMPNQITDFDT